MSTKIAVVGGGSWGTALTKILVTNGYKVHWYVHSEASLKHLTYYGRNLNYLSQVQFDLKKIHPTTSISEAIMNCDTIILAAPSIYIVDILKPIETLLSQKTIVSAIKGIVPQSGLLVGEHLREKLSIPQEHIAVISGPCHAEEVALKKHSYLTIAADKKKMAKKIAGLLACSFIKTNTTNDILGTEYAAVLKNIYAIAAGIAESLDYGDNFQAVLTSNAIREMKRIIDRIHHMKRNINRSAYLGDLLVTSYSSFSRNRRFGNLIGKGYSAKESIDQMKMVAEGYHALDRVYQICNSQKDRLKTPILNCVYQIVFNQKKVSASFEDLAQKLT